MSDRDVSDHPSGQAGYGPNDEKPYSQSDYHHPAAGWGAAMSVMKVLTREREAGRGTRAMFKMNHPTTGFDCPGDVLDPVLTEVESDAGIVRPCLRVRIAPLADADQPPR